MDIENLQNQETTTKKKQAFGTGRKNWVKTILLVFSELILLAGTFYAGIKFAGNKQTQKPKDIEKLALSPITELSITPTPTISVLPSPTKTTQNYPRPANWKTVTIPSMKISLCLPPKWAIGSGPYSSPDYIEIFFERDLVYRPRATNITKIPYQGSSRREEYINYKLRYEPDAENLRKNTTVKELIINGRSVLDIKVPFFGEELVFVMGDYIYAVYASHDPFVNDSRSAFRKDIYTIVGCISPL